MADDLTIRASIRDEMTRPLAEIRDELREVRRETDRADTAARRAGGGFGTMTAGVGGLLKKIGSAGITVLKTAATAVAAIGVAATVAAVKVVGMAMDAAETASKFTTVFGKATAEVQGYIDDTFKRFGVPKAELQDAASTFGVFAQAAGVPEENLAGFSTSLTQAGLDLSSFYNAVPTDVFQALRSGLAGEAEPLRQFGIFLSDATMQAKAAQLGLTGELTESQKVMVRQQIILESLGAAEGDLARTSGGLANQWRGLIGRGKELATAVGTALLPAALSLVTALNDRLAPVVARVSEQVPNLVAAFSSDEGLYAVAEVLDNMAGNTGRLIGPLGQVIGLGEDFSAAWRADGIAGVLDELAKLPGMSGVVDLVRDLGAIVTDLLLPAFADMSAALPLVLSPLGLLRTAIGFLADNAETLAPLLAPIVTSLLAMKGVLFVVGLIRGIAAGIALMNAAMLANPIGAVVLLLVGLGTALYVAYQKSETFRDIVDGAMRAVGAVFQWLYDSVISPVAGFIVGAWDTVKAGALNLALVAVGGFRSLLDFFLGMVEALVTGAARAFGWIPGIGPQLQTAADAVAGFRDDANASLAGIERELDIMANGDPAREELERLRALYRDNPLYVGVRVSGVQGMGGILEGLGDTATSRGRGAGLARTLATASAINTALGGSYRVTNALVGGGGRGHGSGDHQAGRAVDVVGPDLPRYARTVNDMGGYAAIHGTGRGRHVHAVLGDTTTPRRGVGDTMTVRRAAGARSPSGPVVIIREGAVVVNKPASTVDVQVAVERAIAKALRDAQERA